LTGRNRPFSLSQPDAVGSSAHRLRPHARRWALPGPGCCRCRTGALGHCRWRGVDNRAGAAGGGKGQIPPDYVVSFQTVDIVEVI